MKKGRTVKAFFNRLGQAVKRESPIILAVVSTVGIVATTVLAVRATPKAIQKLEEAKNEKGEELTLIETFVTAAPSYTWAALTGFSTIVCVLGSGILNRKKQASLVGAYALLGKSYREYRDAAKRVYGEDSDEKIKAEMAKPPYISADGQSWSEELDQKGEKSLFYDLYSQRYFESTIGAVINAECHVNRNLMLRGYVPLNEYYEFLGIEGVEFGSDFGWEFDRLTESGFLWLDFDNTLSTMDDGLECCIVSSAFEPHPLNILSLPG